MSTENIEKIRAAIEDADESNAITALATVLVERAMQFRRQDGTYGTSSEVKAFINLLTGGIVDICAEGGFPATGERHHG